MVLLSSALLAACGDDDGIDAAPSSDAAPTCADSFDLPGDTFFPEGVAALAGGTVFVGSSTSGIIVKTADPCSGGGVTMFAPSPDPLMGAVGLRADGARGVLWACHAVFDASLPARLDGYHLDTGEVVASHELPGASCNDIAIDADGDLFATDPIAHEIVVVAAADAISDAPAQRWLADPEFQLPQGQFSVNGLVFDPEGTLYVGNYGGNKLYRIPVLASGAPGEVEVVTIDGDPVMGPDGIQWHKDGLLIVENTAGRVSHFTFDDAGVASRAVLAHGLDFPATVAVTEAGAWTCEAQTDHLLGLDPNPPTTPFKVVRLPL
jgi:streptogramin lyase